MSRDRPGVRHKTRSYTKRSGRLSSDRSGLPGLACLGVEDVDGLLVERLSFFPCIANGGQTERTLFPHAVHHVEDDALLAGLVEMQPMPRCEVEEIAVREDPVRR